MQVWEVRAAEDHPRVPDRGAEDRQAVLLTPPTSYNLCRTPYSLHPACCMLHMLHHTPCTLKHTPCTLNPTLFTLHSSPFLTCYTIHPAPCTLKHTPCTLNPTPFTLHPKPHTLHPSPCTLKHTPCTLNPTLCTLHPKLHILHSGCSSTSRRPSPRRQASRHLRTTGGRADWWRGPSKILWNEARRFSMDAFFGAAGLQGCLAHKKRF